MAIDGRVEGTIELRDNTLTIGPEAHLHADIVAKAVTVHGVVIGTITATDAVHIAETGSVEGDITAPRLAMADGAVVIGDINVEGTRGAAPASDRVTQPENSRKKNASGGGNGSMCGSVPEALSGFKDDCDEAEFPQPRALPGCVDPQSHGPSDSGGVFAHDGMPSRDTS
jgi:cytoskeletal protein CcmA (bactofilin family)